MGVAKINISVGARYGRLVVVGPETRRLGERAMPCLCDCGKESVIRISSLNSGVTQSCGCYRMEMSRAANSLKKGIPRKPKKQERAPEYGSWSMMIQRCKNPNHDAYPNYGGRGISVCDRWTLFENFLADMGSRPDGMTIERDDVNGNYEPGNCRWATRAEQNRNRRDSNPIEFRGKSQLLSEWARELGISKITLRKRIYVLGWSIERSFTQPVREKFR